VRIPINLASRPFQKTRPMLVASGATAVLLVGLLGLLISLSVTESGQAASTRAEIARLRSELRNMQAEQAQLNSLLRQPENAIVLERNLFLNRLLFAKGISWTRLFDDLAKVMPYNVRVVQIQPQITADRQVYLDMVVAADSPQPVIEMLTRLEKSPLFGDAWNYNQIPPSQQDPLVKFRVTVRYAQQL
jgi:Tfp pilus assembly protein PilN